MRTAIHVPLLLLGVGGGALMYVVLRKTLPSWRASLAKRRGLDLADLEETTRLLE